MCARTCVQSKPACVCVCGCVCAGRYELLSSSEDEDEPLADQARERVYIDVDAEEMSARSWLNRVVTL